MSASALDVPADVPPGSLEGVSLLLVGDSTPAVTDLGHRLAAAGGRIGRVFLSGSPVDPSALQDVSFVIVAAMGAPTPEEEAFEARTTITGLRAAKPGLVIVLDSPTFAAAGAPIDVVRPYVDAVLGPGGTWTLLPAHADASVDDLIVASTAPGAERSLLPVGRIDFRAVQEFARWRANVVEVAGTRRLTVGEIVARYQAQQRRQDAAVRTTIAEGTTTLLFEVPDFAAPITISAETTIFRDTAANGGTDIEERGIRVNGAAIAGGDAQSPPQLPLIDAERITTPPLTIALDEAYRYTLDGDDRVAGTTCYVVSFEPQSANRGLARGRAWISVGDFTLRRLETIQRDLRGAIVSSEQVVEFGSFDAGNIHAWLPVDTRLFQSYEGAGFSTPIHRTITSPRYTINAGDFASRRSQALVSDNVMLQETPAGLRYLVRERGSAGRAVASAGTHTIRGLIGGLIVDPNISIPLPYVGVSYVNLDVRGTGSQVNVFFGGLYGQASWTIPSIAGTRWQAHGTAFGIAAHYSDRVFRDGREQFAENLVQRPEQAAAGVLRPLTPRLRVSADYTVDVTTLDRTVDVPASFVVPPTVVNHGAVLAVDADRGPWTLRGWWNPVRRQGWHAWGLPGTFSASTRDYQRFGARVTRTLALRSSVSSRVEVTGMAGHDLDRFSRFGFDSFDNPLHGYPTASIRFDRGVVIRSTTAWSGHGWQVDAFGDAAAVHDPGWASAVRTYPGVGAGVESGGPFRTLLSLEWGYGFKGVSPDGGVGTQTVRITMFRGF